MLFCQEYLVDLNGTRACISAGYAKTSATNQAAKLLALTEVRRYISYLKVERAKRLEVSQDRIVEELSRVAFHDKRTYYDSDGFAIALNKVTDGQQTAIKDIVWRTISVTNSDTGEIISKRVVERYLLYNRMEALRMLGHHLGMSLDKPADKIPEHQVGQKEVSFEYLIKNLKAEQLEQLTKWLMAASNSDQEENIPKEHWSNKGINESIQ